MSDIIAQAYKAGYMIGTKDTLDATAMRPSLVLGDKLHELEDLLEKSHNTSGYDVHDLAEEVLPEVRTLAQNTKDRDVQDLVGGLEYIIDHPELIDWFAVTRMIMKFFHYFY